MGKGQTETELAGFPQNRREGFGGEVLELIDVEEEWPRSASGTSARLMAASCKEVMSSEPSSPDASSPSLPFDRFTSSIRPSSRTRRRSSLFVGWPTMLRRSGDETNWPTLFCTGATASAWNLRGQELNSCCQKSGRSGR